MTIEPGISDVGGDGGKANCAQCGKPVASSSRVGSLTSYLFQSNSCTCNRSTGGSRSTGKSGGDQEFCPRCGLERASKSKVGSLTGYLFQHTKCRCDDGSSFNSESMAQKFWKLKEEGAITSSPTRPGERGASANIASHVDLIRGTLIGGAYKIIELIGSGGMGEVYLAEQITMGKECALKVIPPQQVTEMGWLRFQNEAKIFARLQHPNLVRVFDLGIHDGCLPFYAMDFVDGDTLSDLLTKKGPTPLQAAIDIFAQVCDGVDYAHRNGVIHRDLKPANIMIMRGGGGAQKLTVKVLDFGLAKLVQKDRATQSLTAVGEVFGSPFYMSPEQCSGQRIDNRSDIYSVGCALFECLTGRPPFRGTSAVAITSDHMLSDPPSLEDIVGPDIFPDAIEVVMAKLLRKNPAERYQTLAELKGDLERVVRGETVQPFYMSRTKSAPLFEEAEEVVPPFLADKTRTGAGDSKLPLIVGAASILLIGAAFAGYFFFAGGPKTAKSSALPETKLENPYSTSGEMAESEPVGDLVPRTTETPLAWDGKPFFRGLKKSGDKLMREWDFPVDSNGTNYGLFIDTENEQFGLFAMSGKKSAPVGRVIAIEPMGSILRTPHLLEGFTDGNIEELRLKLLSPDEFEKITAGLAHLKSLSRLHFDEQPGLSKDVPSTAFMASVLKALAYWPNVEYLSFSVPVDGAVLARSPYLKNYKQLKFDNAVTNFAPLAAKLAGSTKLLKLEPGAAEVAPADLANLAKCPNLNELQLVFPNRSSGDRAAHVMALSHAPSLARLTFKHLNYTPGTIPAFSGYKALQELHLNKSYGWDLEAKTALKVALPRTKIYFHQADSHGVLRTQTL